MLRGQPGTRINVYQTLQLIRSQVTKGYLPFSPKAGLEIATSGVGSIRDTGLMGDETRGEPAGHAAN